MSWLATLDAKARAWPLVARWPYRAIKWFLLIVGIYLALALAYIEVVQEHRLGLGGGIIAVAALALIKGLIVAWGKRH